MTCYSILLLIALFSYSLCEPYWLIIKRVDIDDKDIPGSFDGTKIAFISDIHHGPFFSRNRVRSLVGKVNELDPDIVILGGDYVHRDPKYIAPCFDELKNLKADTGKFGVLGNHDHWEGAALTRECMKKSEITLIDNQAGWIRKGSEKIKIGGVGEFWEDAQDIYPTIHDVKEEDFVILVSHNPDFAEKISGHYIDLVLSGHTHGGQVTLFGLWAPLVPSAYGQKYRTGMVYTKFTNVLITNGVGTITPPVRFFARPEIVLITLKHKQK
ncbi:MAG: metallophosphoesterase [Peptococcaceae bacterium BRH_c4b]|nr:MAG: metallophosphoesterase [Peptococcaceae bacterium BRH_c4b]